MTGPSDRIEAILKRTRIAYIADTTAKLEQIHLLFRQWADGCTSADMLIDMTHRHVHGMKGLALTLNYPAIHEACEPVLSILQHQGPDWTKSDIYTLRSLVGRLQESADEAFAAGE